MESVGSMRCVFYDLHLLIRLCVCVCVRNGHMSTDGANALTKAVGEECSSLPRSQTVCEEAGWLEGSEQKRKLEIYNKKAVL